MASDPPPQSVSYRPSGKVNWARFLPALIFPILVGVVMALVLSWAYFHRWYYSLIAPALTATVVGMALYLAVLIGHCRNRLIATLAGVLVGAAFYLGYYHVHLVSELGWQRITRVDLLPKAINQRMRFGVWGVNIKKNPWPPNPVWNWTRFGIDLALAMTIVAGLARSRAGRVYCESCGGWMRRHSFVAAPGRGWSLAEALKHGEIDQLQIIEPYPVRFLQPAALIDVEFCPGLSSSNSPCLAYITVSEFSNNPSPVERNPPDHSGVFGLIGGFLSYSARSGKLQKFLKQQVLDRHELLALADKLPRLRSVAVLGLATRRPDPTTRQAFGAGEAAVIAVEDSSAAAAFSTKMSAIQISLSLVPILLIIAGAAIFYAAWTQWPHDNVDGAAAFLLPGLLIAFGLLAAVPGMVICWNNVDFLNHLYTYRLTRRLIRARPDALVDPDDPEAVFVAVVPRERWTKLNLDDPSDRGFLLVDLRGRRLLFEGLKERYRLPAQALTSCENEAIDVGGHFFATVIRARVPGISADSAGGQPDWAGWEAPFRLRPTKLEKFRFSDQRSRAWALAQRICQLLPSQHVPNESDI